MHDFEIREQGWARFGHSLIHLSERLLSDPAAYAVFDVEGSGYYVQWHGVDDRALYLEAASGLYADEPLTAAQSAILDRLGWDPPRQGWGKEGIFNWSRLFTAPVSRYHVVRLTVATLRDVYGATPDTITVT